MQSLVYSTLFGTGLAGLARMQASLDSMASNVSDRALTNQMGAALDNFNEYGCWCYFDDLHGKGKSHATDEIDAYCQILAEGYDCAVIDGDDESEPCIPWEVDYESATVNIEQVPSMCAERNDNSCAIRACIVEQTFVTSIFQSFLFGYSLDPSKKHSSTPGFVEDNCPTKECPDGPGNCFSEKSCCGDYPARRVFKTHGGQRACCGSKTYDQDIMQCCEPNKVKMVC